VKRLISLILLFSFITVNFSKLIILIHYQLNKTEITEKYCENKDKPTMHCCGKCHLKKALAQDDANQKSPAVPDIKNDIQLFGSPITIHIYNNTDKAIQIITPYIEGYAFNAYSNVFHPPQA
jgi:hypothetical protein